MSNTEQLSEYDERPDPKTPGKQGVLFRRVAPAMTHEYRYQRKLRAASKETQGVLFQETASTS